MSKAIRDDVIDILGRSVVSLNHKISPASLFKCSFAECFSKQALVNVTDLRHLSALYASRLSRQGAMLVSVVNIARRGQIRKSFAERIPQRPYLISFHTRAGKQNKPLRQIIEFANKDRREANVRGVRAPLTVCGVNKEVVEFARVDVGLHNSPGFLCARRPA